MASTLASPAHAPFAAARLLLSDEDSQKLKPVAFAEGVTLNKQMPVQMSLRDNCLSIIRPLKLKRSTNNVRAILPQSIKN